MASSSSSLGRRTSDSQSALPVLRDAFGRARAFLTEAKRRSRVLDFADLEVHALRALEHEEVRDYYRERWRAFLVDEFQDTNPVQAELLDRLTAGSQADRGGRREAVHLRLQAGRRGGVQALPGAHPLGGRGARWCSRPASAGTRSWSGS